MKANQRTICIIYSANKLTGLEGVKVTSTTAGGKERIIYKDLVSACIPEHIIKFHFPNSNFEVIDTRD